MTSFETPLQNRYRVIRLIAEGGMGAVYEAEDERLGCKVAIKRALFQDNDLKGAFEREARLLAGLRHPGLPRVSDHFTEDGAQYLVMEFIPGIDLERMMVGRAAPFSLADTLRWGDQLLDVLDYLHGLTPPIVHRDIKPQNLKLGTRNEIILLDFGLAKGKYATNTYVATGTSVLGFTLNYAPPEQIQAIGTDARSDLYGFAATMYHLMTGQMPADAMTRAMTIAGGQPDPLLSASSISPDVPVQIAELLEKGLKLKRDHRPGSVAELHQAWREAMAPVASPGEVKPSENVSPSVSQPVSSPANRSGEQSNAFEDSPFADLAEELFPLVKEDVPTLVSPPTFFPLGLPADDKTRTAPTIDSIAPIQTFSGHAEGVRCLAVAPDGRRMVSGGQDGTIRLWDTETGREIRRLSGHSYAVEAIAFSPDGHRIVSGGQDRTVRLWDADSGSQLERLGGHTDVVRALAFARDGRHFLSGGADKSVFLWDSLGSAHIVGRLTGHTAAVSGVACSVSGIAASCSADRSVRLWDVVTRSELKRLDHRDAVWGVAFSPDGKHLATAGSDKTVTIWNVQTGEKTKVCVGHTNTVACVAFSPGGVFLLSGGSDVTIRVWNARTGESVGCLESHQRGITSVAFSPDGNRIFAASWDKTIRMWELVVSVPE